MKLYSNNYTLKTISNSNSNLHKKLYSKILIFLILIYKLLLIKLKFEMYLRAPSRCGGRRPGAPGARAGAARGAGGRRRGAARGRAAARAERAGGGAGGAGGASGRRRWGTRARFKGPDLTAGSCLPPDHPAVGSTYRRFNRR